MERRSDMLSDDWVLLIQMPFAEYNKRLTPDHAVLGEDRGG